MIEQRRPPSRQNSNTLVDMMRDSLHRLPSFTARRHPKHTSNHSADEMNVFASDIVSKEYILDTLKDVRHNPSIVKLEIEDLLIAKNHNSFLPVVKAILVTDERKWKYLRFIDTIDASDILWWQGMKHVLMREYEASIEDKSKYAGLVTFQASIRVMTGASKKSIQSLFTTIQNDEDVQHVNFAGALFGYSNETLPNALSQLFDETGQLKENLVVDVSCGWATSNDHEKCACNAMEDCVQVLLASNHTNSEGMSLLEAKLERGQRRRTRRNDDLLSLSSMHSNHSTASARSTRSEAPRAIRKTPRRTKSSDLHQMAVRSPRNEDELSLASTHSTRSSASVRSSRSEGALGRRRTPARSKSSDLPTMVILGNGPRRCLTLPTPTGNSVLGPKRGVPCKSKSFKIERPSQDCTDEAPISETSSGRRRLPARRTKSFQHKRPTAESLTVDQDRWDDDKRSEHSKVDAKSSVPGKPVRYDSSSLGSSSSARSKLRRTKSLDRHHLYLTEHGNTGGKRPDYDWSKGTFVKKGVLPSAA